MRKKVLAMFLAVVLAVSLLPGMAWAADSDFVIEDGVLTRYYGFDSEVIIPDGVTSIGDSAFNNCASLTSVTIPDSVTTIDGYAFAGCRNLTSVTIPDSVTSIGYEAFYGCSSLTSVTIPEGVTTIDVSTFYDCTSLTSVTIPDSVTSIGYNAFNGCKSLASVTIPNSVTTIEMYAFYNCTSLTSVTIPEGVTSIGDSAFMSCSSLASVTIPESVTSIGQNAFRACTSLTSVTISDGVTSIGYSAFHSCNRLASVTIPASVTFIDEGAFYLCESLTDIYYGGTQAQWNDVSIGDYNDHDATIHCADGDIVPALIVIDENGVLTKYKVGGSDVVIPDGVTAIGESVFVSRSDITSVTIPEGVTSIGHSAFMNCSSLASVTIPASVTTIGEYAFDGCISLTDVYYGGSESQWEGIDIKNYWGGNDPLLNANIHYAKTEEPTEPEPEDPTEPEPEIPFTDVPENAYYAEPVAWAAGIDATLSNGDGTFGPNDPCTRAEIVAFLWRAKGMPEPTSTETKFTDLDPAADYYKAVLWAVENGITNGRSSTIFDPDGTCYRKEAITFQWRAAGKPTVSGGSTFNDVPEDAYFADAVAWAVAEGIASGTGHGAFSPDLLCTRAQIVTFLYRQLGK